MKKPKMWRRGQNGRWYVTINGEQIPLGKDRGEAEAEYQRLLGAGGFVDVQRVDDLLDIFLGWVDKNRAPTTLTAYGDFLRSFNRPIPRGLRVCDLKPYHVSQWLDKQKTWNTTTKNGAVRALKRAFNWAVEEGRITHSPIAHFKAPPRRNRETLITSKMWTGIGQIVKDRPFRDMLMILKQTGCRPIEARIIEAKHVRGRFWVFPKVDSKGQKYNRLVPLNRIARRITRRLMKEHPQGPLFRDTRGEPWTKNALICRFKRLSRRLGTNINAYAFRHTFCTEALERGLDSTTVAILMGHRDTTMVARVYSHLTHNQDYLLDAMEKATGNSAGRC